MNTQGPTNTTGSEPSADRPPRTAESSAPSHRVLVVGNHLSGSGRGRTPSEDLAVRLQAHGAQVTTTSSLRFALARGVDMLGTAVFSRNRYDVAILDVFSGRAFRYAEMVTWVVSRLGKPIILTLHGGALPKFAKSHSRRVKRLFDRASAITCPSPYLARHLSHLGSIQVLPNPIDTSAFTAARERTQTKHDVKHMVWLRAFHPIYRPQDAVRVAALLHQRLPEVKLTMIGPVKDAASLTAVHDAIRTADAASYISVVDHAVPHAEVPDYLSTADVFLNTTSVDNTPVSVLEAMASGVPVVSTNAGGLPDLLGQRAAAELANVGDVDHLARATEQVLTNPALHQQLRHQGLDKARECDWHTVLPQWLLLIKRLTARPTP